MNRLLLIPLAVVVGVLISASAAGAATATKHVAIVHVQKGCHVWMVGGAPTTPTLRLSLHRCDTLGVVNQDLDMHKLVEVSGPSASTGPFLMMGQRVALRFTKAGRYRFHTRVADVRGMPKAKTVGPDNNLALTVSVRWQTRSGASKHV